MNIKKLWYMMRLATCFNGFKRADILRRNKVFGHIGKNVYYHPYTLPSEPQMVYLHDNVQITAGVLFVTHDIIGGMLNNTDNHNEYRVLFDKIEVFENCSIGAKSMIMPGVSLGPNVIVAAGSVVTKSFSGGEAGCVIGGNPARVISSDWEKIKRKRIVNE